MKRKHSLCSDGDGGTWFRGPMIGRGSFGSVYIATLKKPKSPHSYLPSVLAVKSAEVSVSASLQKEKEVLNNVEGCRHVLRCFGEETTTNENGEMVYNLLLEYGSGGTLGDLIKKSTGRGLPECDVRRYTRSIIRGLNHIHQSGYVHCDLKPDNILLVPTTSGSFVAKIGDFGLAKRTKQTQKRRFDDLYLRGTPLYLSPEVVVDNIQEPPSDVWALGCVVLEMLTGKLPWDRKPDSDTDDLLHMIGYGHELPKVPTEISKEAKAFLKGCFVRKTMFRLTAEMLLNHPFVAGEEDEDEEVEELVEVSDDEEVRSSLSSTETDDELSSSSLLEDLSFISEEGSSFCSWSEEVEDIKVQLDGSTGEEVIMGGQKRRRITSASNHCR